jgi:diaminohydroxyphosphoribosylaminopyrimidine deaminase / 5-amino-6-(5-phosphoribosylamino)uracil reductase
VKTKPTDTPNPDDKRWMRAALALARRGVGQVWPNPAVGCVIVQHGNTARVVGRGWTQSGGRPHAEAEALARAGKQAKGATAYVTLEPCAHTGKTRPCADALVEAGITRAVIALIDPDARVAGKGIAKLRDHGITVEVGCCEKLARQLNAGFLSRIERDRPWVAIKLATTLDGKIATRTGHSKWITGPEARARGHLLRARFDAILTGSGTVRADNPQLTCRLPGLQDRSPVPVVMTGEEGIPPDSHLATNGATRIYDNRPVPGAVLADLAGAGITRVMIEAGAGISAAFYNADLIDEVHWFRAPTVMGADGLAAIGNMGHDSAEALVGFTQVDRCDVGADTYEVFQRQSNTTGV